MKKIVIVMLILFTISAMVVIDSAITGTLLDNIFWLVTLVIASLFFLVILIAIFYFQKKYKFLSSTDKNAAIVSQPETGQSDSISEQHKVSVSKEQLSTLKRQSQGIAIVDNLLNYIRLTDSYEESFENNNRLRNIVNNFFIKNQNCTEFLLFDSILPADYIDSDLLRSYEQLNLPAIEGKYISLSSSISYQFLKYHYLNNELVKYEDPHDKEFLASLRCSFEMYCRVMDYKRMKETENNIELVIARLAYTGINARKIYGMLCEFCDTRNIEQPSLEDITSIYDTIEKLLSSLISTGHIDNDIYSKTALIIFINEQRKKFLKDQFIKNIAPQYNLYSIPENIDSLAEQILKADCSFPIEQLILYGNILFNPQESYFTMLKVYYDKFCDLNNQIKRENYISSLESLDDESAITAIAIDDLNEMNGYEFENFIASLFSQMGYKTTVTKKSGDQGVDILAEKNGVITAIQAKCYNQPVGNKAVQEIVAGIKYYGAKRGIVATNNTFTSSAKKLAKANGIALWDGETILYKYQAIQGI